MGSFGAVGKASGFTQICFNLEMNFVLNYRLPGLPCSVMTRKKGMLFLRHFSFAELRFTLRRRISIQYGRYQ